MCPGLHLNPYGNWSVTTKPLFYSSKSIFRLKRQKLTPDAKCMHLLNLYVFDSNLHLKKDCIPLYRRNVTIPSINVNRLGKITD